MVQKFLQISIKTLLFLTALTPLIVSRSSSFPYMFGKLLFFRSVVEIALILFLIYLLLNCHKLQPNYNKLPLNYRLIAKFFQNPLFIFTCLFIISLTVSAIFAVNSYRAFWGTIDRGEGLFGILHCFAVFLLALFFFKEKDWFNLLKIYLVGGFILVFYAFLQRFKIYNFPFALAYEDPRPGSFLGNSSFLATHLIFIIFFAVIVFFFNKQQLNCRKLQPNYNLISLKFWRYFSLLTIFLSAATIFLASTRGAILGLGAGFLFLLFYFAFKKPLINADSKPINADKKISVSQQNQHKSAKIPARRSFSEGGSANRHYIAVGLLTFLIIFGGIFWATRHHPVWQKIPGFNRLAQTSFMNINDPSTQTRLITWKLSWKAFKEKPLFGWGPENFLIAYEKYYDPNYAIYGETWMDRAHNKIFDLLAMQGIFGLLIYLGIFASAFYLLFEKPLIDADEKLITADNNQHKSAEISINQPKSLPADLSVKALASTEALAKEGALISIRPFIMAGLIAYFIQNLVLFDQLNSDLVFFVILGFIVFITSNSRTSELISNPSTNEAEKKLIFPAKKTMIILIPFFAVAIGFLGYAVYAENYIPFIQSQAFQKSPNFPSSVDLSVKRIKEATHPYNFAQYDIRSSGVDTHFMDNLFYDPDYMGNSKYWPVADSLIEAIDELGKREPYDVRILIREVEMLNAKAKYVSEKEAASLFAKAEELMREAVKRAPNRQEVYYHLSFNLAGQKRYDESIETAQYAVSLNSKVVRAHYYLALMLMLAGKNEEAAEELNVVENISPDLNLELSGLLKGDLNTVMLF